jgi:hypothetical protein
MTHFGDIKTNLQPLAAHRRNDAESAPETADVPAGTRGDLFSSKENESIPRPALRRIVSDRTYPEGGREAWLVVVGCFSGMMASFGFMATSKSMITSATTF